MKHTQLYTYRHYNFVFIETEIWVQVVSLGNQPPKWEQGSEKSDTRKEEESFKAVTPVSEGGRFC